MKIEIERPVGTNSPRAIMAGGAPAITATSFGALNSSRSEEHTSELQSPCNLVCRLLLEKKKQTHTCRGEERYRASCESDGHAQTTPPQAGQRGQDGREAGA